MTAGEKTGRAGAIGVVGAIGAIGAVAAPGTGAGDRLQVFSSRDGAFPGG